MADYPSYPSTRPYCRCMENDNENLEEKDEKSYKLFQENKLKMVEELKKNKTFDVKEYFKKVREDQAKKVYFK